MMKSKTFSSFRVQVELFKVQFWLILFIHKLLLCWAYLIMFNQG
ncbi:MAG: hypothetical protein AB7G93_17555 [Bdellovibrionales bacterium]